jgi:putative membrane protein
MPRGPLACPLQAAEITMSQLAEAALAAWRFPCWTSALLAATTALYLRGFVRVHRQMPLRFPLSRLAFYLAGIATLAIALISPLEALDDRLLITHMLQHLLLLLIAPPLLLLGAPQIPLVRAIPPAFAKPTIGLIAKSRACRFFLASITHPTGALTFFSLVMLGWHLPGPFQLALRSDAWHIAEHGCFILAGTLFWYPIVSPWPAAERCSRWALVPYLLIADVENSLLGAFMVFSGRLLYPFYAEVPRVVGITTITDQIVAGAIMWVPGSILLLVPAVAIVVRALQPAKLARSRLDGYADDPSLSAVIKRRAV